MLCHKCKVNQPFEDDSWCLSCSAWESIGSDLVGRWDVPGLRELACEAVVATARHLKGLRRISAGLASRHQSSGASTSVKERVKRGAEEALSAADKVKTEAGSRSPLPRSRSKAAPVEDEVRAKAESHESSDYEEVEEEEESEEFPGTKRLAFAPGTASGARKPAEPAGSPPASARGDTRDKERKEHRDDHHRRREEKRSKDKGERGDRKRRRRGGRKHKNLARLVDNPRAKVHRSLDSSYWSRPPRNEGGFSRHT